MIIKLEAEDAHLYGDLKVKPVNGSTVSGLSGGKYVGDFILQANSYLQFTDIEISTAGAYELRIFSMGSGRPLSIKVNQYRKSVVMTENSPAWDEAPASMVSTLIYLDAGKNKLTFGCHNDHGPNLDKFEIHSTNQSLPQPEIEKIAFVSSFADEAEITAQHANETLPYVADNDEYTIYKAQGVSLTQIVAKCKQPVLLTGYLLSAGLQNNYDTSSWELEMSKDGQRWENITPSSITDLSGAKLFSVSRLTAQASTKSAQYYRLTAKGNGNVEVAEWQLFGIPYVADSDGKIFPADITEGLDIQMIARAFPEGSAGQKYTNLFNRKANFKYLVKDIKSYSIEIELNKPYKLHSSVLTSAADFPDRDPKRWTLNGFNPEIGWVELNRQTEFVFPGRLAAMRFDINTETPFTKILLAVEDNNGSADSHLLKWQLFGEEFTGTIGKMQCEDRADSLLKNMTLHEKLIYLGGVDWMFTKAIPRLSIPQMKMSDGPQGLGTWGKSTAYPCALMLAATWNRDLANRYGAALAQDCKARSVNVLLGPGVNIYRAPMCGRNFEYMGEDPFLAAEISTEYIKGLQQNGVMGVVKHFTANFQEYDRNYTSSDIDERTLHEIYFPAFRAAVQKAGIGAVMTSYNLLNGVWTTLDPWLLKNVLREQWGFDGLVMSDWGSTHYGLPAATSGLDLEMPGNERQTEDSLRIYLANGQISIDDVELKIRHTLKTFLRFGFFDNEQLDSAIPLNNPATVQTASDISAEGIVLLKNEGNILPLKPENVRKIAVIGNNATAYTAGNGSGLVYPFSYTSYYDGLKTLAAQKGIEVALIDKFDHFDNVIFTDNGSNMSGFKAEYFNNKDLNGTPVAAKTDERIAFEWTAGTGLEGVNKNDFSVRWTAELRPETSGSYEFIVSGDDGFRLFIDNEKVIDEYVEGALRERRYTKNISAGQNYAVRLEYFQSGGGAQVDFSWFRAGDNNRFVNKLNEADVVVAFIGHNQSTEGEAGDRSASLPSVADDIIKQAETCSKPVIAVVNAGGNVYMQDWEPQLKALIWAWYGGQEAGVAMGKTLLGEINPSGKLPVTFEKKWADNPAYNSYYDSDNDKHVRFSEGVFIGYRGYDKLNRAVQYPFGFGLSYTTFEITDLNVATLHTTSLHEISFKIKNTGTLAGAEVVQLYVGKNGSSEIERPLRELKNYDKVFLQPGEKKTVTMTITNDDFKYYSVENKQFIPDNGIYRIEIGTSSRDIKLNDKMTVNINSDIKESCTVKKIGVLYPTVVKAGETVMISAGKAGRISVFNLKGQKISEFKNTGIFSTTGFPSGVYLIKCEVENENFNNKIIVL
ncbi:MAG: glycoside hydrolase family 3 C-terminal domain-containing protein [Dysgonamonadaceae bacterium]|nr:glycoside hydrolase family 3 C-terminal domain-containing protein [Dysgonamonadaceae bacterium]